MHLPALALPGAAMLLADPAAQRVAAGVFGPRSQSAWGADLLDFSEAVHAPALLNSWVDFGAAYAPSGFWKDPNGQVHLRGVVKNGTAVGTVIFTLPPSYAPAFREVFAVSSNGSFGAIDVMTSGDVVASVGSTASFSLSGISFRTP